jgi:amino acid transporter
VVGVNPCLVGAPQHEAKDEKDGGKEESPKERLDRELIELLNELRVALPGVQVLFAFLLTIPFTGGFQDLSDAQRGLYFATFTATIASTAFLMTPTAYHRLRWRRYDKERMLRTANRTAVLGLACLALAICGAAYLIAEVLFGTGAAAATVAAAAALIGGLWFVLPLVRELKDDGSDRDD